MNSIVLGARALFWLLNLYFWGRRTVLGADSVCYLSLTYHFTGVDRPNESSEAMKLEESQPGYRTLDFLVVHPVILLPSPG